MSMIQLHNGLRELLDRPVAAEANWEWAVWGDIASVVGQLPKARRSVVLVTADDTELRLLPSASSHQLLPFAALSWVLGGAIPRSILKPQMSTWSQPLLAAEGVEWLVSPQRSDGVLRPALAPQPWHAGSEALNALIREALPPRRTAEVTALEAGWLQLADDLDASHRCSQSIEGAGRHQSGDYWHAIMHRREPDYGNSKYWFHQFQQHPAYAALTNEVPRVSALCSSSRFDEWTARLVMSDRWNPTAFVACCEAAASSDDAAFRAAVEELQYREMLLLLAQSLRDAAG